MVYGWYLYGKGARERRYVFSSLFLFLIYYSHSPAPPSPLCLCADDDFPTHSELAREKMWSRIHLIPALQAEEDRDQVRRHLADQARERTLTGGDNFKVYHSDKFVKPTFAVTPEQTK